MQTILPALAKRSRLALRRKEKLRILCYPTFIKEKADQKMTLVDQRSNSLEERVIPDQAMLPDDALSKILLLTPREKTVLCYRGKGLTNKQIAEEMSISEKTVENKINEITGKIGISGGYPLTLCSLIYAVSEGIKPYFPSTSFTEREKEIVLLRGLGFSNEEAGNRLVIKEKSVENYTNTILRKLQAPPSNHSYFDIYAIWETRQEYVMKAARQLAIMRYYNFSTSAKTIA